MGKGFGISGRIPFRSTTVMTVACALVACAVVILSSIVDPKSLYIPATSVVICAVIPFFVSFEGSGPKAHEVALIGIMCALAVVSRIAFFAIPQFKPTAAVVILGGVAFGARPGFLIGTLSMLLSNLIFGQGPWTPWQMLAFGSAGLVFGALSDAGLVERDKLSRKGIAKLSIGGFAFVVFVLGPILDTSSLFMIVSNISPSSAVAVYLAGMPMNVIHAVATAVTLSITAKPLLGRLARVRVKYGIDR